MHTHNDLLTKTAGQIPARETKAIGEPADGRVISPIVLHAEHIGEPDDRARAFPINQYFSPSRKALK